jgi:uncharacterized LabA/DUF88 family protein
MFQIAAFVDAGYLYAQGSALLAGSKKPRHLVRLNVPGMLADLRAEAKAVEPNARLLRIYWYDGLIRGGALTLDQRAVAESEDVKCRFGTVNSRGEQKGVDSLIVTDLIELARGQAISDALIMSGDEDIRVGVQVAQSFGIRVHLLGIQPARGSQSPDLVAEADTLHEWASNSVETWMTVVEPGPRSAEPEPVLLAGDEAWIARIVQSRMEPLDDSAARNIYEYAQANRNQLPADFDRPSLASARESLNRDLTPDERKSFRAKLLEALRERAERAS